MRLERLTEREDKAGIFLTQQFHLPPWSRIDEIIVFNTVDATIQQNEATRYFRVGSWVEPRDKHTRPLSEG
jgi:hypothetical protein